MQFSVGSLWAQRPGCAGAPSQLESSGGAEWFQSSPGTGIVERCPPPPSRTARSYPAAGARAAARGLGLLPPPPPPPPPPRGRCSPRAGCAQSPPAAAAGQAPRLRSFLSLLSLSPPPPCVHSLLLLAELLRPSRSEVPGGKSRAADLGATDLEHSRWNRSRCRRPPAARRSPGDAERSFRSPEAPGSWGISPGRVLLLLPASPRPQGKEPPLGPARWKLRRQRAAG